METTVEADLDKKAKTRKGKYHKRRIKKKRIVTYTRPRGRPKKNNKDNVLNIFLTFSTTLSQIQITPFENGLLTQKLGTMGTRMTTQIHTLCKLTTSAKQIKNN